MNSLDRFEKWYCVGVSAKATNGQSISINKSKAIQYLPFKQKCSKLCLQIILYLYM